jgi:hypothetical protein
VQERPIAREGGSVQDATMAVIAPLSTVLDATVVPDCQHIGLPTVSIDETVFDSVRKQSFEQLISCSVGQIFDTDFLYGVGP